MRAIEMSFVAAVFSLVHFVLGQWAISSILIAIIAALMLHQLATVRHRKAFRNSLRNGAVLCSFSKPSVFGNPSPYSWFRCRDWYEAKLLNSDGTEIECDVLMEGTFFGLFKITQEKSER